MHLLNVNKYTCVCVCVCISAIFICASPLKRVKEFAPSFLFWKGYIVLGSIQKVAEVVSLLKMAEKDVDVAIHPIKIRKLTGLLGGITLSSDFSICSAYRSVATVSVCYHYRDPKAYLCFHHFL